MFSAIYCKFYKQLVLSKTHLKVALLPTHKDQIKISEYIMFFSFEGKILLLRDKHIYNFNNVFMDLFVYI